MKKQKQSKKYPILAVRISEEGMEHIRRSAQLHRLSIPQYVRSALVPLEVNVRKIIVDKL